MKKYYIDKVNKNALCVGCGLCESIFKDKVKIKLNDAGMYCLHKKDSFSSADDSIFKSICPILDTDNYSKRFWGDYNSAFYGYSTDTEIRFGASSGGVITQTLVFLLETNNIEAILHVGTTQFNPLLNESLISTSRNDLLRNMGSRYAPVKLLSHIDTVLETYSKIAVVGKPCDLRALNNYLKVHSDKKDKILYRFSFFCGGIPSQNGTSKILRTLGVDEKEVIKFDYRGNGWPGLTTVTLANGQKKTMEYNKSWGKILGRDIHKTCKFCPDGLGEESDFSCGDGWYSSKNGCPDFDEKEGRNIILCRTEKGLNLLNEMVKQNVMELILITNPEDSLAQIQLGQYFRKSTLYGKVLVMRLCGKYVPTPRLKQLWNWREDKNILRQVKVSIGTLKRLLMGKI